MRALGPEAQALLRAVAGGPAPEAVFAQRDTARQRTNAGKRRLGSDGPKAPCLNRIICRTEVIVVSCSTQILITVRLNQPSILWWSVMPLDGVEEVQVWVSETGGKMVNIGESCWTGMDQRGSAQTGIKSIQFQPGSGFSLMSGARASKWRWVRNCAKE